jgi:hypothetical protein
VQLQTTVVKQHEKTVLVHLALLLMLGTLSSYSHGVMIQEKISEEMTVYALHSALEMIAADAVKQPPLVSMMQSRWDYYGMQQQQQASPVAALSSHPPASCLHHPKQEPRPSKP